MTNKISFTQYSKKNTMGNDKPNEDYILINDNKYYFIILDGVSRDRENGKYPNPSPSAEITQLLAKSIYKYLQESTENFPENSNIEKLLYSAMKFGNETVKKYPKYRQYDFLPGAVGIVSIIVDNVFYYAYIGDCIGLKISKKERFIFTDKQTKLVHKYRHIFDKYTIRNIICNNPNHPYAYGVLNGNENVDKFIQTGNFILNHGDKVILATDGVESYIMSYIEKNFELGTAKDFVKASDSKEEQEDDKSVIIIDYEELDSNDKSAISAEFSISTRT